jgi:hypothetical protein
MPRSDLLGYPYNPGLKELASYVADRGYRPILAYGASRKLEAKRVRSVKTPALVASRIKIAKGPDLVSVLRWTTLFLSARYAPHRTIRQQADVLQTLLIEDVTK